MATHRPIPRFHRVILTFFPALFLLLHTVCRGHVADTSLLRVSVLPTGLRLEFNLDLQTLSAIQPLDADQNGAVDRAEFNASLPTLQRFFQERVRLTFGSKTTAAPTAAGVEWQSASEHISAGEMRNAHIQFSFENPFPEGKPCMFRLQPGVFETFGANHRIIFGVVEGETSDQAVLTQTEPAIEYTPRSLPAPSPGTSTGAGAAHSASSTLQLFSLGVEHILTGYDHLLFLFTLLLAASRWGQMVACVTAFTCAHSLTLAWAALQVSRLPDRWVESSIAASIAWVAVQNLRSPEVPPSWRQTFAFGLLHGLGFATLFRDLNLPRTDFLRGVLTFNLGVETGQIAILLPLLPALLAARSRPWHPVFRRTLSAAAFMLALFWLVERLLA
jgi:hydrogenase/urease accessory protein HupE